MNKYPKMTLARLKEIIEDAKRQESVQSFVESMMSEREIYQDAQVMIFYTVEARVSHYKEKLNKTKSYLLRKAYLNLLIECLMEKIIKDHC